MLAVGRVNQRVRGGDCAQVRAAAYVRVRIPAARGVAPSAALRCISRRSLRGERAASPPETGEPRLRLRQRLGLVA